MRGSKKFCDLQCRVQFRVCTKDWQLSPIWAKYFVSLSSDFRIWFMYILETNVNVKGQKKVEKKSGSRKWGGRGPDSRFLQLHFIFWTTTIYILNKYIYIFNRYNWQFQQIQFKWVAEMRRKTPDADIDKNCFNVDWNKENNPRLLNIPAKTEDKKY